MIGYILAFTVFGAMALMVYTSSPLDQRRFIVPAAFFHLTGTALLLNYTGGRGDMGLYAQHAMLASRLIYQDVAYWVPEVGLMLVQQPNALGLEAGTTGSMTAFTCFA